MGSVDFGVKITNRFRVATSAVASFFPQFQFSLLPSTGAIPPAQGAVTIDQPSPPIEQRSPSLDYALSSAQAVSYGGIGIATYQLSKRSSISATYGRSFYKFVAYQYEMPTRTVGGVFTHQLTRYASLRLGSTEQRTEYPTFIGLERKTLVNRVIDAGVNYSRPLSMTRKTIVSFGTGSGAVDIGSERFYTITANASLQHQLARRWIVDASYSRGTGLVGGFTDPFFADSVVATLDGRISRLLVTSTAAYSTGVLGLGSHANDFNTIQAATRFEVQLKPQRIAIFGSYYYYGYSFAEPVRLASGLLPRQVGRHGVRGGLTVRVPLLKERTTRASR
jgi:hypothetical protein